MTIIIDAPMEVEAAILEKAERIGLSLPEYFLRAAVEWSADAFSGSRQETTAETQEQAWQEARGRIKQRCAAGVFAGASVDGFLASRAEDARFEDENEARIVAGQIVP